MKKWNLYKPSFYLALFSLCTFFSGNSLATVAPVLWHTNTAGLTFNTSWTSLQTCSSNWPTTANSVESANTASTQYTGELSQFPGVTLYFKRTTQLVASCKDGGGNTVGGSYALWKTAYCVGGYPTGTGSALSCGSCQPPTVDNGSGVCTAPPVCPSSGSVTYPTAIDGGLFVATKPTAIETGPNGDSFCLPYEDGLCEVKCTTGFSGPNPIVSGYAVACTSLTATGSACQPDEFPPLEITLENPLEVQPDTGPGTEPTAPGDCPPGTGFAQINNKGICLPSGTDLTGSTSETTTDGADGPITTKVTTDWQINPDGTRTGITTTTNTDAAGNVTTTTKTATGGIDGGGGSGGGGDGGGNDEPYNPGPAPTFTDPGNGGAITELTVGQLPEINWHQTFLPEGGSCAIADIPVDVMGITVNIPLSAACEHLPIIRGLIIFMAVLASIRVFAMAPW